MKINSSYKTLKNPKFINNFILIFSVIGALIVVLTFMFVNNSSLKAYADECNFKALESLDDDEYVSLKQNGVQYRPVFDKNHPLPNGVSFYAKTKEGKFTKINYINSGDNTMKNFNDVYISILNKGIIENEIFYKKTEECSFTCVAGYRELFDDAFGSFDDGVASTLSDNIVHGEYIGTFPDKQNAICVPLTKDWYSENPDCFEWEYEGRYGPGKNFNFFSLRSEEPEVNGVGINSIQEAYKLDNNSRYCDKSGLFWSCVSIAPTCWDGYEYSWCWIVNPLDTHVIPWGYYQRSGFDPNDAPIVLFSRVF